MARKGENIYKRKDGRWEGRYIKGRRPDGKTMYGSIYGKKYSDVKARLIPMKSAYAARKNTTVYYYGTLWDWLVFWLEDIKPNVKPATYASYRHKLQTYVLPELGNKQLDKLTQEDIQSLVKGMEQRGFADSSINTVYRILNNALHTAAERHYLFINPCNGVVVNKAKKKGVKSLTLSEQKALEKQALQEQSCSPVILGLYTGMRIGEISALRWEDIDFESGILSVRRTLQRISTFSPAGSRSEIVIGTPKSDNSFRIIPLSSHLLDYLKEWKEKASGDYVISCKNSFAEPRVISYRFKQTLNKAGISNVNFHSLRHTFATRALERGVDITTLSSLLGHASAKMTLDTYTDSMLEQRKAAMLIMDMLLSKESVEDAGLPVNDPNKLLMLIKQLFVSDLSIAG